MRIVTWNVNGLRSLIRSMGSIERVFSILDADIVCFQVGLLPFCDVRKAVWE